MTDTYWQEGRYNGMTFEEYVAKAHEVMETNRRVERALRDEVAKREAQYLDAFDQVTGYIGAIVAVRRRYPDRFARTLCDEIERLADENAERIVRSRRAGTA